MLSLAQAKEATPRLLLHGVSGDVDNNIRALVDVSRYQCELPNWRFERIQKRSKKDTNKALRALGYYNARIETNQIKEETCWQLEIVVTLGDRVTVDAVNIKVTGGLEETEGFRNLTKTKALRPGLPLNHADYEKLKLDISSLASQYGYFSGTFLQHELKIDVEKDIATVNLHYESGERASIGKISLQQSQFRDKFVKNYLTIEEGDAFDSTTLTRQQSALNDSGYFSSVAVEVERNKENTSTIPIKISLEPRKRHAYRVGIGASTNEGPRVSLKFEDRWLNRRAHRYVLNTSWSQIVNETGINYTIPLGDAGTHKLDLGAGYKDEDVDTSSSQSTKFAAKLTRVRGNGWKLITSLELLREKFSTADSTDDVQLITPGIGYSKSIRDRPLLPRAGWRISSNLKFSSDSLWSDVNMTQFTGSAKIIRPVNNDRILARGSIGLTKVDDFSKLPSSLRFFSGGDNSVRGFEYKSLGPTDNTGSVIGGENSLSGSIEYERILKQNWGAAVFLDAGNAFSDFNDYEIEKSIGIGARYHSPIGPIRLDLAHNLSGKSSDIRLHLSMGPDL